MLELRAVRVRPLGEGDDNTTGIKINTQSQLISDNLMFNICLLLQKRRESYLDLSGWKPKGTPAERGGGGWREGERERERERERDQIM